ncbi:cytochrome c551, partial [Neisseria shayeganii 871]
MEHLTNSVNAEHAGCWAHSAATEMLDIGIGIQGVWRRLRLPEQPNKSGAAVIAEYPIA